MSKSIKLKNNNFIDSTSITHNRELLSDILQVSYVLYESESGTNQSIVLDDNADNYDYIEIFYGYGTNSNFGNNSCKVFYPFQKTANLVLAIYDGTSAQQMMATVNIDGINVVFQKVGLIDLIKLEKYDRSYIRIYKIIGYK